MNLSNLDELQTFLQQSHLRPKDYLGQNFLVDEDALAKIIEAAELQPSDTVLEVGPGLGVLTKELLKRVKRVVAVEKDRVLIPILKKLNINELANYGLNPQSEIRNPKLQVINQDILSFHAAKFIDGDYKVVANIPYYLTSKLLQHFLELATPPKFLVLMVQKEVGERVIAKPGELSVLGISVQIYADAEIMRAVPKTSFWPVPKVDSVILKITPHNKYPEIKDKKIFFRLIKLAFAGKRKQIHNTLTNGLKLPKDKIFEMLKSAGIEPTTRPQDVEIGEWIALYKEISQL